MDYQHAEHVAATPEQLYGVLATPENLTHFVPQLTAVTPIEGDRIAVEARYGGQTHRGEAWLRCDETSRRVEWGVDGTAYRGAFDVEPDGDGAKLVLHLSTARDRDLDADVAGTLDAIRRLLEAEV